MVVSSIYGAANSLQVSYMKAVNNTYSSGEPFLIYNGNEDSADLTITPLHNSESISVSVQPGWFPVVCKSVNSSGIANIFIGR